MKKLSSAFIILIVLFNFGIVQNIIAQENTTPPLLIQQNQMQTASLSASAVPPPPGMQQPPAPGIPPSAPTQAGIPVVQTIPTQTLLANLQQAVITAEKLNKLLTAGKVWFMRTPSGETEIKAGILYQGVVIAILHFNSEDGSILPLGINPHSYQSNVNIQSIRSNLLSVINNLRILPIAEFMEPEACWSFPVAIGNTVIAHVKIYFDGIHVVQDYLANQEMVFYGQ